MVSAGCRATRLCCDCLHVDVAAAVVCLLLLAVVNTSAHDDSHKATSSASAKESSADARSYRLPTDVRPLHYNIETQVYMTNLNPQNFTFKGRVRILVKCDKATNYITLHANILKVDNSSIRVYADANPVLSDPQFVSLEQDQKRHFLILKLDSNLQVGKNYWIEMSYTSPLTNSMLGLYYSSYKRGNETVYLVATQFQSVYARQAFPCFDEPAMKATFNISIIRPANLISLSNMPRLNHTPAIVENGTIYVKDSYQTSPIMSTYLVAMVICDYFALPDQTKRKVPLKMWTKQEVLYDTKFALDTGVKFIDFFEEYFNLTDPLPKQDMITIPGFMFGAMENWGLNTYREIFMLYKRATHSVYSKLNVLRAVPHEIAHTWFGNIVTMSWWDGLWLNEAFSTFFPVLADSSMFPQRRAYEIFISSNLEDTFDSDATVSSSPLTHNVNTPDEIENSITNLIYTKGAGILSMLQFVLGEKTFKMAVRNYLHNHMYGTVTEVDLQRAFTQQLASEDRTLDVTQFLKTWTHQMNYPVVTVTRDVNNIKNIDVIQERFLADPLATDPCNYKSPYNYRWMIPLTFVSSEDPTFGVTNPVIYWMYADDHTKSFAVNIRLPDRKTKNGWILANYNRIGLYRVNYDTSNWLALAAQLNADLSMIPGNVKAQLIDDAFALAKAGRLNLRIALKLIESMEKERSNDPWHVVVKVMSHVTRLFYNTPVYDGLRSYMGRLLNDSFNYFMKSIYTELSDMSIKFAQLEVIEGACYFGHKKCLNETTTQFKLWMENPSQNAIQEDMKKTIYKYGVKNGGFHEWNFTLNMYQQSTSTTEKTALFEALGHSVDPRVIEKNLNLILEDSSPLDKDDAAHMTSLTCRDGAARAKTWAFFKDNYQKFHVKITYEVDTICGHRNVSTNKGIDELEFRLRCPVMRFDNDGYAKPINDYAQYAKTEQELNDLIVFKQREGANMASASSSFDQAINQIKFNMRWVQKNLPIITQWLQENESSGRNHPGEKPVGWSMKEY